MLLAERRPGEERRRDIARPVDEQEAAEGAEVAGGLGRELVAQPVRALDALEFETEAPLVVRVGAVAGHEAAQPLMRHGEREIAQRSRDERGTQHLTAEDQQILDRGGRPGRRAAGHVGALHTERKRHLAQHPVRELHAHSVGDMRGERVEPRVRVDAPLARGLLRLGSLHRQPAGVVEQVQHGRARGSRRLVQIHEPALDRDEGAPRGQRLRHRGQRKHRLRIPLYREGGLWAGDPDESGVREAVGRGESRRLHGSIVPWGGSLPPASARTPRAVPHRPTIRTVG